MNNLTPLEYDSYVRRFGVRAALDQYPYTLSYRYVGQLSEHQDHTMFYHTERDRETHARSIQGTGGIITGASGGNTAGLVQP